LVVEDFDSIVLADLDTVFGDVDLDGVTYSAVSSGKVTATIDGENILSLNSVLNAYGLDTVVVTADDQVTRSTVSDTILLTITAVNDTPRVMDIPDQTIVEGSEFTAINLDDYLEDVDNPDTQITWNYSGNNELVVSIDPSTRVVTVTIPNPDWNGSETVIFTAFDSGGLFASDGVMFTVVSTNDAPLVVQSIPDQSLGEDFGTVELIDLDTVFEDPDNQILSYSVVSGGKVLPSLDGKNLLSITSVANFNGMDTVIVTADDLVNRASVSDSFVVTVTPVNDAPYFVYLPDTIAVLNTLDTTIILNDLVDDVDSPRESFIWEIEVSDPSLLYDYDPQTSAIRLSAPGYSGIVEVSLRVSDDGGASATATIVLVIADPTGISEWDQLIPERYELSQNYPNPFNPTTTIRFGLPVSGEVKLEIYNIVGQRIATVLNEYRMAGYHEIGFDAGQMASGLYILRLEAGGYSEVKKMVLSK